eukprot:12659323-Alexandrium_andersonii.AAC.1
MLVRGRAPFAGRAPPGSTETAPPGTGRSRTRESWRDPPRPPPARRSRRPGDPRPAGRRHPSGVSKPCHFG